MHNLVGHQLSQYQHELEDKSPDPSANIALITPKKKPFYFKISYGYNVYN